MSDIYYTLCNLFDGKLQTPTPRATAQYMPDRMGVGIVTQYTAEEQLRHPLVPYTCEVRHIVVPIGATARPCDPTSYYRLVPIE